MLPKSNQINYDALDGFFNLYTHSFSLENLRLPLPNFFCDVLKYFRVHLSRLNLFGCAKLTTFAVMCKAYGDEQSVDLFRGFFNLYPGGEWLTFAKRPQADVPTDCVNVFIIPDITICSSFLVIHLTMPTSFFFLKPDILFHGSVPDQMEFRGK
ncbi:hypothetical protein Tco_1058343 [Tanacetum coccineum]|uniref:Transposase (putative) gypsy type domain-containing protein n=1 Tax=Tanacetum coccineum TaxID=301880 RepID=A0ABQ5H835_9ASTR